MASIYQQQKKQKKNRVASPSPSSGLGLLKAGLYVLGGLSRAPE